MRIRIRALFAKTEPAKIKQKDEALITPFLRRVYRRKTAYTPQGETPDIVAKLDIELRDDRTIYEEYLRI